MEKTDNIYDELKNIFHEPKRLAIMTSLCASQTGMTFNELKESCDLTDGNLNRHLKVLNEAGAIEIKKTFVGVKPRTTVYLSDKGIEHFNKYLEALAEVLEQNQKVMTKETEPAPLPAGKTVRA